MNPARVKRGFDVMAASLGLIVAAPLMAAAALAIWSINRGPVLFWQVRDGYRGHPFRMWKLRTMVCDGDALLGEYLATTPAARTEWETYFRLANDPRVLGRVGRTVRRFSLDELPQLWNVLRGDMSLVGPRPLPDFVIDALPSEFVDVRRAVRPGMTGLWQVSGRSDGDIGELIRLDRSYLASASLALDLRILSLTPRAVLSATGAY
jgi:lipopolysaccharide/colanic/teichoic acid biosynthesis glycosyltransferase